MRTRNPFVLAMLGAAAAYVAVSRRQPGTAGRAVSLFVRMGLVVIAIRVTLTALLGVRSPGTTILTLPSLELPEWAAGVSLGGAVTVEQVLFASYQGLQLAVILVCFGAANSVCSSYRLLRSVPPVLHEAGVAVGVAVSLTPQLVVSVTRVRSAHRLRGRPGGLRGMRGVVMPVLEESLERAIAMAASMDVRGYGRSAAVPAARRRLAAGALLVGLVGLVVGSYALLDGTAPAALRVPALAFGGVAVVVGLGVAGGRVRRTSYRRDVWEASEWGVSCCGVLAAACVVALGGGPGAVTPTAPPAWPTVPALALVAAALAAAPAVVAPPVPGTATSGREGGR